MLCSPHRLQRPWQGQVEDQAQEVRPEYDPACYLCPGNVRANGQRNPAYTHTFAFDNDFPALLPASDVAPLDDGGLLVAQPAVGRCRVICFSPRHDLTLAEMPASAIRPVVDAWAEEVTALGSRPQIRYVQVFENRGEAMGCSNPHPHGQIWATCGVPNEVVKEDLAQAAWQQAHARCLLCQVVADEISSGRAGRRRRGRTGRRWSRSGRCGRSRCCSCRCGAWPTCPG